MSSSPLIAFRFREGKWSAWGPWYISTVGDAFTASETRRAEIRENDPLNGEFLPFFEWASSYHIQQQGRKKIEVPKRDHEAATMELIRLEAFLSDFPSWVKDDYRRSVWPFYLAMQRRLQSEIKFIENGGTLGRKGKAPLVKNPFM